MSTTTLVVLACFAAFWSFVARIVWRRLLSETDRADFRRAVTDRAPNAVFVLLLGLVAAGLLLTTLAGILARLP